MITNSTLHTVTLAIAPPFTSTVNNYFISSHQQNEPVWQYFATHSLPHKNTNPTINLSHFFRSKFWCFSVYGGSGRLTQGQLICNGGNCQIKLETFGLADIMLVGCRIGEIVDDLDIFSYTESSKKKLEDHGTSKYLLCKNLQFQYSMTSFELLWDDTAWWLQCLV